MLPGKVSLSSHTQMNTPEPPSGPTATLTASPGIGARSLSQPSVVKQVDTTGRNVPLPHDAPGVVLLDGGINDVSLTNIFTIDPTIWDKPAWISKITSNAVEPRMQDLLAHVFTSYPQAYVIVTGYYQIISDNSERTAAAAALVTYALDALDASRIDDHGAEPVVGFVGTAGGRHLQVNPTPHEGRTTV